VLSTAYHSTRDNLVAKWWPDGREAWKTVACGALGNNTVAKFQLQLLSFRFRLSQFFNPRLYLVYRFKHGKNRAPTDGPRLAINGSAHSAPARG
jgi:hypothetical protein